MELKNQISGRDIPTPFSITSCETNKTNHHQMWWTIMSIKLFPFPSAKETFLQPQPVEISSGKFVLTQLNQV